MKKYLLTIIDEKTENNISIKCNDPKDLAHYAAQAIKQGYKKIIAEQRMLTKEELEDNLCDYCIPTERGREATVYCPSGLFMCEGIYCDEAYETYLEEEEEEE